jgi:hypothetical protein
MVTAAMVIAGGVIALLVFFGWLIYRVATGKSIKAYAVMYGLSFVSGIFTFAYFLAMEEISSLIKVLASIAMGILFIYIAARVQRKAQSDQS